MIAVYLASAPLIFSGVPGWTPQRCRAAFHPGSHLPGPEFPTLERPSSWLKVGQQVGRRAGLRPLSPQASLPPPPEPGQPGRGLPQLFPGPGAYPPRGAQFPSLAPLSDLPSATRLARSRRSSRDAPGDPGSHGTGRRRGRRGLAGGGRAPTLSPGGAATQRLSESRRALYSVNFFW